MWRHLHADFTNTCKSRVRSFNVLVLYSVQANLTLMSTKLDWDGMTDSCCRRPCVTVRLCFKLSFSADKQSTRFSESVTPWCKKTTKNTLKKLQLAWKKYLMKQPRYTVGHESYWDCLAWFLKCSVSNTEHWNRFFQKLTDATLSLDSSSSLSSIQLFSSSIYREKINAVSLASLER